MKIEAIKKTEIKRKARVEVKSIYKFSAKFYAASAYSKASIARYRLPPQRNGREKNFDLDCAR